MQEAVDRASFEANWHECRLFGLPAWGRYAIAIGPAGANLPAPDRFGLSAQGANLAAGGVAGLVNGAVSLRKQVLDGGPSLGSLAVVPGVLGLAVPTVQTVAGAALVLGAAAASRLRGR
jgi:hypothetical protein